MTRSYSPIHFILQAISINEAFPSITIGFFFLHVLESIQKTLFITELYALICFFVRGPESSNFTKREIFLVSYIAHVLLSHSAFTWVPQDNDVPLPFRLTHGHIDMDPHLEEELTDLF